MLFERLVEQYLEYSKVNKRPRSYERDVTASKLLLLFFRGKYLTVINPFMIERYKKKRLKEVQSLTINRKIECLKHMFSMARDLNLAKENPVKKVGMFKTERRDVMILSNEKEAELYRKLPSKKTRAIVATTLNTGMRKREILDLEKGNVDLKNWIIHVTRTKNWEVRDIPMNESLTKILKDVIDESSKESPYVFVSNRTGRPFKDVKSGFKAALRSIGLGGFRFHDLRHTWCSRMCELGVDEATIMEIGGWKTRSMINRYAHPSMDHKREALEKLNKVPRNFTLDEKPTTLIKLDKSAN